MRLRFSRVGRSFALVIAAATVAGALVSPPTAVADDRLQFTGTTLSGAPFSGSSLAGKPAVLCATPTKVPAGWAAAHPGVTVGGVAAPAEVAAHPGVGSKYKLTIHQLNDAEGASGGR